MTLEAMTGTKVNRQETAPRTDGNKTDREAVQIAPITITKTDRASQSVDKEEEKNSKPNTKQIKEAVAQANIKIKSTRTGCQFTYHEKTNVISITVFDEETKEVIREIPPEKILDMVEKMWELAGMFVDEKR